MLNKSCMNWDGDEDCNKCATRGYIYSCPDPCPDYAGFYPLDLFRKAMEPITIEVDHGSTEEFLKAMKRLDQESFDRMFTPGNRFELIFGEKRITYVAEGEE